MSDADATPARQDVVAEVDEIIEHVINANMLSMPYHVYSELFDAVDGLGVEIENLQSENAKLRELVKSMYYDLTNMTFPPDWVTDYEADMRELGVEVQP